MAYNYLTDMHVNNTFIQEVFVLYGHFGFDWEHERMISAPNTLITISINNT